MTGRIRILLADDHDIVRVGFRLLLNGTPDLRVVAEAGSGEEALRVARETEIDVAVLDITLPGMTGLETARRL
ncbi:MAG: response regulator transcription factor, partial [Burkholderiaceae bacterium]|nr:response regulator transcription factor [Burkholderiaceae bacterium]